MKARYYVLAFAVMFGIATNRLFCQVTWEQFGDTYPTSGRTYSDVSCFFTLEGPGNENPGNYHDLDQGDPNLRIPEARKQFIARQFKYVLNDGDGFCDRDTVHGTVVSTQTSVYHQEAVDLMNRNPDLIVFPYFSFTLIHPKHRWYAIANQNENWFLHELNNPNQRLESGAQGYYVMDVRNEQWRDFYVNYIVDTISYYQYRGVFLDIMTRYPWVSDTLKLPLAMDAWLGYLESFVRQLTNTLPSNIKVVCNSIGIDDPTRPRVWGPNYGLDLMPLVSGGAACEGFHSTAWRSGLDIYLSVMNYMRDSSKIFLAETHYTANLDRFLSRQFWLEPTNETGWLNGSPDPPYTTSYPPYSTFYRMQMSYLARFLLVSPGNQPFGFKFQPGEWLDSYIPYYKPWDERIGTPTGYYTYNATIRCYEREFANAKVYVNTDEELQTTITIPSGWHYYPYPSATAIDMTDIRVSSDTAYTLNRMEGIVLFKKVQH